ncbi:MAG TPA: ChbG/HpnK family deacetylase [Polyangiaceae bacterium]|nr:ChbG/HpnK family deacetylase [Polyangiaceae bacterium]
MSKRLLVTSDDFGMCHAVNAGIVRAMRHGIVRATNFLVPCPWFSEALSLAREHALPVGVHLCLTCDWDRLKWGPLTRAASLCDAQGHLFQGFEPLLAQASDADLLRELLAQVERVESLGFSPSHLDSHMLGSDTNDAGALRLKALIAEVARQTGLRYSYDTDEHGKLRHFDREIGLSGRDVREVWHELEALPARGTYHLIGHAAEPSAELESLCSPEHPSRLWAAAYRSADIAFFTSPIVKARLAELDFELISEAEL